MDKECKKCGEKFKPEKNRRYCKNCSKLTNSSTIRMIRNREFIRNYKREKRCENCGYNKYTEILIFHHKNKKEKIAEVNVLMKTLKNLRTINEEIKKCALLCPNCHHELHLKERMMNKK